MSELHDPRRRHGRFFIEEMAGMRAVSMDEYTMRNLAGMQNAYVSPREVQRRAISSSELPRLNRLYRWAP